MTQPHGEYRQEFQSAPQLYQYGPASQAIQPYQSIPAPFSPIAAYPIPANPHGYSLVSAGGRLGARLLDGLLVLVTLGIGWLVWSCVTWSDGQSPAKKLLGHVVADVNTGEAFGWGRMAARTLLIDGLLGWLLDAASCGIYFWVDSLMVLGDGRRTLHDRMAGSIVRHV